MKRYILLNTTLCFMAGIIIGNYWYPRFEVTAGLGFATLIGALIWRRTKKIFGFLVLIVFIFFGAAYEKSFFVVQGGTFPRYTSFKTTTTLLEGVVDSEVGERHLGSRSKQVFVFKVQKAFINGRWRNYQGKVMVNFFKKGTKINYGDRLRLQGKLHRPFSNSGQQRSTYRDYLARQGIYWMFSVSKDARVTILAQDQGNQIYAKILRFRERLRAILRQHLNYVEAAIMETMLLGTVNDAPRYIQDLFRNTGTTHILAISGLHVALMAVLIFLLLKTLPIGRRAQAVITIVLLLGYTLLTGSRPSAVRAFLMASTFLASALVERESESLNSLALSAFILCLINPFNVFDVGFQLSYICVLGIILLFPLFWQEIANQKWLENEFFKAQAESLILSLAVWLAVGGFIAYYFEIISPVTIFANLLAVPLSELVLVLGTGLFLAGLFLPWLAGFFAVCLQVALNGMVYCVYLFAKIPFGYFHPGRIPLWAIGTYYMLIVLGFWLLQRRRSRLGKNFEFSTGRGEF